MISPFLCHAHFGLCPVSRKDGLLWGFSELWFRPLGACQKQRLLFPLEVFFFSPVACLLDLRVSLFEKLYRPCA
jgi:hypothetical protein